MGHQWGGGFRSSSRKLAVAMLAVAVLMLGFLRPGNHPILDDASTTSGLQAATRSSLHGGNEDHGVGFHSSEPLRRVVGLPSSTQQEEPPQSTKGSNKSVSRARVIPNCSEAPPLPNAPFRQVQSYMGPVEISDIQKQMVRLEQANPLIPPDHSDGRVLQVVFFALDGTLLNLLRWGRIVNDNDIDLGFFILENDGARLPLNTSRPLEQYLLLQKWLFARGLLGRSQHEKDVKKLHNSRKALKPQTCKHRGQMMQCRLDASAVIVDWFGVETLEVPTLTDLGVRDFLPLLPCKAFSGTFPCPARYHNVLKQFTLNLGTRANPAAYREFAGCAMFPRRIEEQTDAHVGDILEHGRWLSQCGYPHLISQLDEHSTFFQQRCKEIVLRSAVHVH